MQVVVDDSAFERVLDEAMKKRGYVPEKSLIGRTIGIKEFAKKYCYPHGIDWVKKNIFYQFNPDWVVSIHPGERQGLHDF